MPKNQKTLSEQGFTLVEMALVIIIGGVMLSLLGSALISFQKKNQIRTTEHRIETISEALERYLSINARYPCPANRTATPDDADFGRTANTNNCQSAATGVADAGSVKIGAVPTRTLNLPDEYASDSWGRKFTYAVTEVLATAGSYAPDAGTITVNDLNGNTVINPANTGHYIITSHGSTGMGGFIFNGTAQYTACSATFGRDSENCDGDTTFIASLVTSEATGASYYDDYLYAKGQTAPSFVIPADAVMAFALDSCPPGWSTYAPAQGRFVMGGGASLTVTRNQSDTIVDPGVDTDGNGSLDSWPVSNLNLDIENIDDGDVATNTPRFVALLYCRKDP